MGHGIVLVRRLLDSMAGLPLPLVVNRLVLALADALDELPAEKAVEVVAWSICDARCRSCDNCDPQSCIDVCITGVAERLMKEWLA